MSLNYLVAVFNSNSIKSITFYITTLYKPLRQARGGPSPVRLTVQRDMTSMNFNKDFALAFRGDDIEAGGQRDVEWLESVTV